MSLNLDTQNQVQGATQAGSAGSNNDVVQEVYLMLMQILAENGSMVAKYYLPTLMRSEKYQHAAAALLAMLAGNPTNTDLNQFGQYWPFLLRIMNGSGGSPEIKQMLDTLIKNNPYFRKLFDQLHADIEKLQVLENQNPPNKAAITAQEKTVKDDINLIQRGSGFSDKDKQYKEQYELELSTAKILMANTRATATIWYEKTLQVVNTIRSLTTYTSAMMKRGNSIKQGILQNTVA